MFSNRIHYNNIFGIITSLKGEIIKKLIEVTNDIKNTKLQNNHFHHYYFDNLYCKFTGNLFNKTFVYPKINVGHCRGQMLLKQMKSSFEFYNFVLIKEIILLRDNSNNFSVLDLPDDEHWEKYLKNVPL